MKWTHGQGQNAREEWRQFSWNGAGYVGWRCPWTCSSTKTKDPHIFRLALRRILVSVAVSTVFYVRTIEKRSYDLHLYLFESVPSVGKRSWSEASLLQAIRRREKKALTRTDSYSVSLAHSLSLSRKMAHPARIFHTRFAFQVPPFILLTALRQTHIKRSFVVFLHSQLRKVAPRCG